MPIRSADATDATKLPSFVAPGFVKLPNVVTMGRLLPNPNALAAVNTNSLAASKT